MHLALRKAVVVVLCYFGIFVPTPAPEGWQTYRGKGFTLHLPPYWKELRLANQPGVVQFAPPQRSGDTRLSFWTAETGKIDPVDMETLQDLQDNYPRKLAVELQKGAPRRTYTVGPVVYDDARHRLWFKVEERQKGSPLACLYILFLLTEKGSFQIIGSAPAGDRGFEEIFRETVNSLELDEELRFREPISYSGQLGYDIGAVLGKRKSALGFAIFLLSMTLIGVAVVVLSLDSLLFRGRVKAALIRGLQRIPSRRLEGQRVALTRPEARLRRLPLRWSLAGQMALSFVSSFWIAPLLLRNPQLYRLRIFVPCYLLGYGLLLLAVALHYLPDTSRRLKYELLAAALSVLAVPGLLSDPWSQVDMVGRDSAEILGGYYGLFLSQTFYFALAGVALYPLLRAKGSAAERRASLLYRLTYRLKGVPVLLTAITPLLPVGGGVGGGFACFVACYLIGEKALERPFLYLRSFHDRNTTVALGKIVMPAVGRFAPVLASAHALQPPEELYRRTNILTTTRLTLMLDTAWQEWILATLPCCHAVLIDISVRSEGLLWELERAREALSPQRIVVLAEEGVPFLDIPGVREVRYQLGWRGQRAARKALRRWLKELRASPLAEPAAAPLPAKPV